MWFPDEGGGQWSRVGGGSIFECSLSPRADQHAGLGSSWSHNSFITESSGLCEQAPAVGSSPWCWPGPGYFLSLTWPYPGSYATEILESLPLAAGSGTCRKTSATGSLPSHSGGPRWQGLDKYSTQPLPAPLRGLWDLRDPFSPLRQLRAVWESWPRAWCLTFFSRQVCLAVVVPMLVWGSM